MLPSVISIASILFTSQSIDILFFAYINNLGIPDNGLLYQNLSDGQDAIREFIKTQNFFDKVFLERVKTEAPLLFDENMSLEFINYGDTQLVYMLMANLKRWSVLVSQPGVQFGISKREFDNLRMLSVNNPDVVVKPEYYFEDGNKELYVAPYIYQARCIASQSHGYGVYIPEPYYRFECFNEDERKIVSTCMIANLVRLYDEERNLGIGACKIGGGDFILDKSWDKSDKSLFSTLEKMKLIAAREMFQVSLLEYEQLLLEEFSKITYYSDFKDINPNILINHKNRVPMSLEEIKDGIELGYTLRKIKRL